MPVVDEDFWLLLRTKYSHKYVPVLDIYANSGFCQLHLGHTVNIMPIKIHALSEDAPLVNDAHKNSLLHNISTICYDCRNKYVVDMKFPKSHDLVASISDVSIKSLSSYKDDSVYSILNQFLELCDKVSFNNVINIDGVYLVEDIFVPDKYHDKLNIVIGIKYLQWLGYFAWALASNKTLLHLWEDGKSRTRFFSSAMSKLLITLGKIHHKSKNIRIWVMSYGRIVSIEAFSASTPEFTQLDTPVVLTRITK